MAETWPRLSVDLDGPVQYDRCQACCETHDADLRRWVERGDDDEASPTDPVVVLCKACCGRLIEAHPRLYHGLHANDPHPGCMALCVDCMSREGNRCTHPDARVNGGPGVILTVPRPIVGFVDTRGKRGGLGGPGSGPFRQYPAMPRACRQRAVVESDPDPPAWGMRSFSRREIEAALCYAACGGQALHLHRIIADRWAAPKAFVREVDAGRDIAHLFDMDRSRLESTARDLGVKVIVVERAGSDRQHVDLCGLPLRKALARCVDRPRTGDQPRLFD